MYPDFDRISHISRCKSLQKSYRCEVFFGLIGAEIEEKKNFGAKILL